VNRRAKRRLVGTAAGAAAVALGTIAGREAIRRERNRPDPEGVEALDERPGVQRWVRSFDGTELAVNVVGPEDGPTLVFVHGFGISMTAWHYQWKYFSSRYRCVLFDQRGHGMSEPAKEGDYSEEALGRDLRAVLDAEVAEGPAVVIGHSMGGMSVLALAHQHPEEFGGRIRGVVLANTAASDLVAAMAANLGATVATWLSLSIARLARHADRVAAIRSRAFAGEANLAYLIGRLTNFGPHASPALVEHVVGLAARTAPEVWSDLMASLVEMDLTEAIEQIRVPTLVLVGDVDRLTPPASALAIKHRLPDARMVVLEGAGHCAMLERHEQWNQVVGRFVGETLASAKPTPRRRSRRASSSAAS